MDLKNKFDEYFIVLVMTTFTLFCIYFWDKATW